MRYEKPQILSSGLANQVIAHSSDKREPEAIDAVQALGMTATQPAYEADE